jgi:hypothetical protein
MSSRAPRALLLLAALGLTACTAVRLEPKQPLPPPLIDRLPIAVAASFPQEFSEFVHKERRQGVDYEAVLGPAHVDRFTALLEAMFERVVPVDEPAAAAALEPPVRLVVEPRFEEYAFLTPSDLAGDFYTVTIRYRVDVYTPAGERVDAYVFTGFGREKTGAFSGTEPLARATQRAMRDAGAKFAIEFTEQASVRQLLEMGGLEMLPVEAQLPLGGGSAAGGTPAPAASPAAAEPAGSTETSPASGGGVSPPAGAAPESSPPPAAESPPETSPPPAGESPPEGEVPAASPDASSAPPERAA